MRIMNMKLWLIVAMSLVAGGTAAFAESERELDELMRNARRPAGTQATAGNRPVGLASGSPSSIEYGLVLEALRDRMQSPEFHGELHHTLDTLPPDKQDAGRQFHEGYHQDQLRRTVEQPVTRDTFPTVHHDLHDQVEALPREMEDLGRNVHEGFHQQYDALQQRIRTGPRRINGGSWPSTRPTRVEAHPGFDPARQIVPPRPLPPPGLDQMDRSRREMDRRLEIRKR